MHQGRYFFPEENWVGNLFKNVLSIQQHAKLYSTQILSCE